MTARKSPKKKPASKSRSKTSQPGKKAAAKKKAGGKKATARKQTPARKPEQTTAEREGVVYSDLRHQFRSRLLDRLL